MKIIKVSNGNDLVGYLLVNEDEVGLTLMKIRSATHSSQASELIVSVNEPDTLESVLESVSADVMEGLNP